MISLDTDKKIKKTNLTQAFIFLREFLKLENFCMEQNKKVLSGDINIIKNKEAFF